MKLFAILLFLGLSAPEMDQASTQSFQLNGMVVEEATGEPLAGARIILAGYDKEIFSDFDGNFTIEGLAPGNYDIEVSFISYESLELKAQSLTAGNHSMVFSLK